MPGLARDDRDDARCDPPAACRSFWLALRNESDERDKLPPVEGGYLIRLLIGAGGGAARSFDLYLD
jgi:hypothetical protein